jgi:hypothetical protein
MAAVMLNASRSVRRAMLEVAQRLQTDSDSVGERIRLPHRSL